jgi:hypothetical protein
MEVGAGTGATVVGTGVGGGGEGGGGDGEGGGDNAVGGGGGDGQLGLPNCKKTRLQYDRVKRCFLSQKLSLFMTLYQFNSYSIDLAIQGALCGTLTDHDQSPSFSGFCNLIPSDWYTVVALLINATLSKKLKLIVHG